MIDQTEEVSKLILVFVGHMSEGTFSHIVAHFLTLWLIFSIAEEPVKFCKAGAKLELHCDDGPQGSEFLWQIDDKSVVEGKEVSVDDGSLTFTNLGKRLMSVSMHLQKMLILTEANF